MTTIVLNDTVTVPLNLEETGTLCHLILGSLLQSGIDPSRPIGPQIPEQPVGSLIDRDTIIATLERSLRLYGRLARANSQLMRGATP